MAATSVLSPIYPLGSAINEAGRLEVGGCDLLELAREFGTPAYVVAEDDLRARARMFVAAMKARHTRFDVLFASKAFPCIAAYRVLAEEGLACDVASGGELFLALRGGFDAARIYLHGNAKSDSELRYAVESGVGHVVIDNEAEIERLDGIAAELGITQAVLIRVTPDVRGATHDSISTGQADSKFGVAYADAPAVIAATRSAGSLELVGLHAHIGSQILDLEPFEAAVAALGGLGEFPVYNLGGGLGVAYMTGDEPPSIEAYVEATVAAAQRHLGTECTLLIEPGRALVANAGVTIYSVISVKRNARTYVGVDGGMSDNMRPMLYGAPYEAEIADRIGEGGERCVVAGKHCESGDVLVSDVELPDPRPGDVLVTPATGAYGHAMANNYNGVPRPPVIFCRDGNARVVVRRETFEDLASRDAS